jgi:hypothetical protein
MHGIGFRWINAKPTEKPPNTKGRITEGNSGLVRHRPASASILTMSLPSASANFGVHGSSIPILRMEPVGLVQEAYAQGCNNWPIESKRVVSLFLDALKWMKGVRHAPTPPIVLPAASAGFLQRCQCIANLCGNGQRIGEPAGRAELASQMGRNHDG